MSQSAQKKKKIVLIDDHEIVRLGLTQVINADSGLEVVAQSGDAQTGLSQIMALEPDVAVVDIQMPGPSVFEMIEQATKLQPKLKIIVLSAHQTGINVDRSMTAGASGFLTKSESLTTIARAIHAVLSGDLPFLSQEIQDRLNNLGRGVESKTLGQPPRGLLSPREVEVLCQVAKGQSAKQIGHTLHISAKTVERHKANIMTKLSLHTQVDLTRYAIREGLISA
jgi:DNA-binding NarL/FixJ family response regulator